MQYLNLIPTSILNSQEIKLENCSDEQAHTAYKKLYDDMKLLTNKNDSNNFLFLSSKGKYNDDDKYELFPFFINAYNFKDYCESEEKGSMLNYSFCLGNPKLETLYYMDKETKNKLTNYMEILISKYKKELNYLENSSDNKEKIFDFNNEIKDIEQTIMSLNYFYDRRMLLFFTF